MVERSTKELILEVARASLRRSRLLRHEPQPDRRRSRASAARACCITSRRRTRCTARSCSTRSPTGSKLVDNAIEGPARRLGAGRSACCAPRSASSRSIPSSCGSCVGRRSRAARSCAKSSRCCCARSSTAAPTFLEREMDAGRLRRYDARQLLLTGYGAVLSYLSDAPLMNDLLDIDPLSADALAARREHVINVLRTAVVPDSSARHTRHHLTSSCQRRAATRRRTLRRSPGRPGRRGTADRSDAGAAQRDVALRVLAAHDHAVGREPHEPFAVSPSRAVRDGSTRPRRAASTRAARTGSGRRIRRSRRPRASCSIGSDVAGRALRVPAVHRGLVGLAPGPEPRRAVVGPRPRGARGIDARRTRRPRCRPRRSNQSRRAVGRGRLRVRPVIGRVVAPRLDDGGDPAVQAADVAEQIREPANRGTTARSRRCRPPRAAAPSA